MKTIKAIVGDLDTNVHDPAHPIDESIVIAVIDHLETDRPDVIEIDHHVDVIDPLVEEVHDRLNAVIDDVVDLLKHQKRPK